MNDTSNKRYRLLSIKHLEELQECLQDKKCKKRQKQEQPAVLNTDSRYEREEMGKRKGREMQEEEIKSRHQTPKALGVHQKKNWKVQHAHRFPKIINTRTLHYYATVVCVPLLLLICSGSLTKFFLALRLPSFLSSACNKTRFPLNVYHVAAVRCICFLAVCGVWY